ncbi:MAG: PQQ-binding-like beta-propeller repeat protein [Gammaproteobacteria bacterium]|nr:PQQ-binding-like beta-propeller repeat protein [Gammaproteobacteria bacterium]
MSIHTALPTARAWPLIVVGAFVAGCGPTQPDVDWPTYLGDEARTHYSPLTDINPANVANLVVAWRYDSGDLAPGISVMDTSPLVIDGVLYGLSPTLDAFALNAATGEELWRHEVGDVGIGHSQRGLLWWPGDDESGGASRMFYVAGWHLIGLDPSTGEPLSGFGEGGALDLSTIMDVEPATVQGPGVVFGDKIVLAVSDGGNDGVVMAVGVADGAVAWRTPTKPASGGAPTAGMALDVDNGLLFVPTEAAMPMAFGPEPPEGDLNANGLLALNVRTGESRWFRPIYVRESWPGRLASPPTLVTFERDGAVVNGVALATRRGHLYVLDRETGEPLSPMTEQGGQSVSAWTFTRQSFAASDRRPEAAEAVGKLTASLDQTLWAPPSSSGSLMFPGTDAGVGWGGAAFDPASGRLIINTQETASVLRLLEIPAGFSDRNAYFAHCARCHGADRKGLFEDRAERYGAGGPSLIGVGDRLTRKDIRTAIDRGRGSMPGFEHLSELERIAIVRYVLTAGDDFTVDDSTTELSHVFAEPTTLRDPDGLPGNAPPWGTLTAFDLSTGAVDWQVPLGEYPSYPNLGLGAENVGGPVVTASGLVFIGATPDMKIRALDIRDRTVLWEADLWASGHATPVVYRASERQFIVIASGGGRSGPPSGSEYVAFAVSE